MTPYYLGGYYLIRPKPIDFGFGKLTTAYTGSSCINKNLPGDWLYAQVPAISDRINTIKQEYCIGDETVNAIRQWVGKASNEGKIGRTNVFSHRDTAKEFQQRFFAHLPDTKIIGIYFKGTETEDILNKINPQGKDLHVASAGLHENLSRKIPETQSATETFIGFDIIGIEPDGDFHTFYCHWLSEYLTERFSLEINQYGLFKSIRHWQSVLDFMNNEARVEPVPWFICKTKLVAQ